MDGLQNYSLILKRSTHYTLLIFTYFTGLQAKYLCLCYWAWVLVGIVSVWGVPIRMIDGGPLPAERDSFFVAGIWESLFSPHQMAPIRKVISSDSGSKVNPWPFNLQIIQFEFSPTWSCVSLTRSTTSSEWKLFRFDKLFSNLADWCHILTLTYLKCGT